MDISTVIGIVVGLGFIGYGFLSEGELSSFIEVPALMVTVGGTFAALMINYRMHQVASVLRVLRRVFVQQNEDPIAMIHMLLHFTERARRDGLLALEDEAEMVEDGFLRQGLEMVIDGTDPELIRNVMETELVFQQERHRLGQEMFASLGQAAPAFGMLGTLIGLVQMLRVLDSPENIGPGLAMALLTTLYGVLAANLIFLPIAGKLRVSSQEELMFREMAIEGVLSIQAGDNPRVVEQKLRAFLTPSTRQQMDQAAAADEEAEEVVL